MGSSHGGAAVSNTDGRGFDSFRACFVPDDQFGHQHLDNCRGILGAGTTGPEGVRRAMGRSWR